MADEDLSIPEAGMDDFAKAIGGTPPEPSEPPNQPRSEDGRYASKDQNEPVTVAVDSPAATPPAADLAAPAAPVAPDGHVPLAALQEERNKRQEMERRLAEIEARTRIQTPQQPQQPQQPQPEPEIWTDPNAYFDHRLAPTVQAMEQMREQMFEMAAGQQLGFDKVDAAKSAFEEQIKKEGPQGETFRLAQQLFGQGAQGNPFTKLVEWHKRQSIFAEVGDDPRAWMEREMEKMLADPAKSAAIMEKIRAGAGQQPSPAVIPNGRSVPPSISAIPGGGGPSGAPTAASDMDAFRNATAGRSRR